MNSPNVKLQKRKRSTKMDTTPVIITVTAIQYRSSAISTQLATILRQKIPVTKVTEQNSWNNLNLKNQTNVNQQVVQDGLVVQDTKRSSRIILSSLFLYRPKNSCSRFSCRSCIMRHNLDHLSCPLRLRLRQLGARVSVDSWRRGE